MIEQLKFHGKEHKTVEEGVGTSAEKMYNFSVHSRDQLLRSFFFFIMCEKLGRSLGTRLSYVQYHTCAHDLLPPFLFSTKI